MNNDRWYGLGVGLTGTLLGAGVLLAIGRETVPDVLGLAQARGHDRIIVAAALLTATGAAWLAGLRFLGPVAASAARQRWLIGVDPVAWQRRAAVRFAPVVAAAAVSIGAVIGLASGGSIVRAVGVGVVAVVALVAMAAGTVVAQRGDLGPHAEQWVTSVALALLTGAVWGPIVGVPVGVIAAAGVTFRDRPLRWRRSGVIPRWNLAAAAVRRARAHTATLLMEAPAPLASSGERRAVVWLPASRPARLAVIGIWRVAGRVSVTIGLGLLVSTVLADLLGRAAGVVAVAVVLHLTTASSTRVLLAWWTGASARRTLALPARSTRIALAAPAMTATLVTVGLAVPLVGLSVAEVAALLLLPVLATWSRVAAADVGEQLTMVSTPMGVVPIQLVTRIIAGFDATAIVLIALLVIDRV